MNDNAVYRTKNVKQASLLQKPAAADDFVHS